MAKKVVLGEKERFQQLLQHAWLNLGDVADIEITNPLTYWTKEDLDNPVKKIFRLMMNPRYFAYTCQVIFNVTLLPIQLVTIWELWNHAFPILVCNRGFGKSFLLALYAMLKALLCPGVKIVIVGAGFRQAKVIFEYCEVIWNNAPILRDLVGTSGRSGPRRDVDRCTVVVGESTIIALPIGDGSKIRGQRANVIIADEFASIPKPIFETVVAGFGVVSMNPVENVKNAAKIALLKESGKWDECLENLGKDKGNQTIISGTAYYEFNHFADYWKRWKGIIESKGDFKKLSEVLGGPDNVDPSFNYEDYCIIKIPVELLPKGFMDEKHVARSRATVHSGVYNMEFGACFANDSNGFYSRKLIESCVAGNEDNPIEIPGYGVLDFTASIRGQSNVEYIFGVDPASEQDRFSIVILACYPNHRRIVYCWTTTRQDYKDRLKTGLVKEQDFYGYCARKIRDLHKLFPAKHIALDSMGGGIAVMEALHDGDKLKENEMPLWPIINQDDPQDYDRMPGEHIIEMVNFSKAEYTSKANHGMRKDFEDKVLLFPYFDGLSIQLATEDDIRSGRIQRIDGKDVSAYDTLEDTVIEIEQLKDELATIIHTQTTNIGRDHWDTPEVKMPGNKKGRLRKDRYSALLMANMAARNYQRAIPKSSYDFVGAIAQNKKNVKKGDGSLGSLYNFGPEWTNQGNRDWNNFGSVVNRGK